MIGITAESRPISYVAAMDGERTTLAQMCPSCGKAMGLSRTVPPSAGLCELQTHRMQRLRGLGYGSERQLATYTDSSSEKAA